MLKVYFAGPLFTNAEREWNFTLVNCMRNTCRFDNINIEFFLPQEEVGTETDAKAIFKLCKEGIENCDIVLANMDGADPDSGTCFECGYAYGIGKPVYTYRTDFRVGGDSVNGFNLMLTESSTVIHIENFSETNVIAGKILEQLKKDLKKNK